MLIQFKRNLFYPFSPAINKNIWIGYDLIYFDVNNSIISFEWFFVAILRGVWLLWINFLDLAWMILIKSTFIIIWEIISFALISTPFDSNISPISLQLKNAATWSSVLFLRFYFLVPF